jgi:CMP-N,N'-diacetyllegionaminic acid synthase
MKVLGIIPARGGSRQAPGKNIRLLAGKPLIAYTIEAALHSTSVERLIVSTDDKKIAQVAQKLGAEVPFLRPADLAKDDTPDQPVFLHALEWLKDNDDYEPEIVVNLRPTTPFKTPQIIDRVVQRIIETGADMVRTMTLVEGVHHPYWMYRLSKDGSAKLFSGDIKLSKYYQRQLLPPVYRINGVADAMKIHIIYEDNILDNQNMKGVIISEKESMDVDTEFDFMLCECILKSAESCASD